jgi:hypothetical protein
MKSLAKLTRNVSQRKFCMGKEAETPTRYGPLGMLFASMKLS